MGWRRLLRNNDNKRLLGMKDTISLLKSNEKLSLNGTNSGQCKKMKSSSKKLRGRISIKRNILKISDNMPNKNFLQEIFNELSISKRVYKIPLFMLGYKNQEHHQLDFSWKILL
jgi:hypothetical protein